MRADIAEPSTAIVRPQSQHPTGADDVGVAIVIDITEDDRGAGADVVSGGLEAAGVVLQGDDGLLSHQGGVGVAVVVDIGQGDRCQDMAAVESPGVGWLETRFRAQQQDGASVCPFREQVHTTITVRIDRRQVCRIVGQPRRRRTGREDRRLCAVLTAAAKGCVGDSFGVLALALVGGRHSLQTRLTQTGESLQCGAPGVQVARLPLRLGQGIVSGHVRGVQFDHPAECGHGRVHLPELGLRPALIVAHEGIVRIMPRDSVK